MVDFCNVFFTGFFPSSSSTRHIFHTFIFIRLSRSQFPRLRLHSNELRHLQHHQTTSNRFCCSCCTKVVVVVDICGSSRTNSLFVLTPRQDRECQRPGFLVHRAKSRRAFQENFFYTQVCITFIHILGCFVQFKSRQIVYD